MPPAKKRKTTKAAKAAKKVREEASTAEVATPMPDAPAAVVTDGPGSPMEIEAASTETSGRPEASTATEPPTAAPEPVAIETPVAPTLIVAAPADQDTMALGEQQTATTPAEPGGAGPALRRPTTTILAASTTATTSTTTSTTTTATGTTTTAADRLARFRALQARARTSSDQNLAEASRESARLATDPSALTALHRRRDAAAYKLLRAETDEAGEDFERKRAWDWTAEEAERWDRRVRKKAAHRDNSAFKDYRVESNKVYKRQVRDNLAPDMERYEQDKMAAVEKAAASGGLEIVETDDGELIAIDKDGTFYSTADSTGFVENKPSKEKVDKLVAALKKAEEIRIKKGRERMAANGDDSDVTYINDKNKHFNQKLARFYNKYTGEIRDSFERGTMI